MKYFLGVVCAGVIWLPLTVVGWGVGTDSTKSGAVYALIATAIPLAALAIGYLIARLLKWREFATAFAIASAVLMLICGMCNVASITDGRPPSIVH
jgi:hypothetical protein